MLTIEQLDRIDFWLMFLRRSNPIRRAIRQAREYVRLREASVSAYHIHSQLVEHGKPEFRNSSQRTIDLLLPPLIEYR